MHQRSCEIRFQFTWGLKCSKCISSDDDWRLKLFFAKDFPHWALGKVRSDMMRMVLVWTYFTTSDTGICFLCLRMGGSMSFKRSFIVGYEITFSTFPLFMIVFNMTGEIFLCGILLRTSLLYTFEGFLMNCQVGYQVPLPFERFLTFSDWADEFII